ncbi:MAG: hypothetical protein JWR19_1808 [Pedosphaera sp.]|nr:hypothetical protein [Pedosphaera sp.]
MNNEAFLPVFKGYAGRLTSGNTGRMSGVAAGNFKL